MATTRSAQNGNRALDSRTDKMKEYDEVVRRTNPANWLPNMRTERRVTARLTLFLPGINYLSNSYYFFHMIF